MFIPAYLIQYSQRYIKNYEKISHMLTMGLTAWVLFSGSAMAYGEPEYKILQSNDAYEIRQYKDRLAVQTIQGQGSSSAFR